MSGITLNINGTGVDLPPNSETTQRYFEKIKATSSLEGFDKHYQATVYTLLMTVSSLFNTIAYGASAIFESALLAPLDPEAAKKNFEEKGLHALESLVLFVAGSIFTVGAIFVPDKVAHQITLNHRAAPDVEDPKIVLHMLGGRMELPQDAKETHRYLTQAKDAKNLTDIEKHYKATAYTCLATVSSFFNALTYGAQALVESALLLPVSVEEAKKTFEEQGVNTLNSTAYFAAGVFMSMEAIVVPDQMCERIHIITPQSGDPDPVIPQIDPIPVGDMSIDEQETQLCMISSAIGRYTDPASIPESIKAQIEALQVAHGDTFQVEALPSLKGILAQLIFLNDDQDAFKDVLPLIKEELNQAAIHLKETKEVMEVAKKAAREEAKKASKESAELRAEQEREYAAALKFERQQKAFEEEKGGWEALIDQSTLYRDELQAQVRGLAAYEKLFGPVRANIRRFGDCNGRDLKGLIARAKEQNGVHPEVPNLDTKPVTVDMRNALAVQYAVQDYSAITATVDKEREALHEQLDDLGEAVEALEKEKVELEGMQAKWEALVKHAESLQDVDAVDEALL